MATQFGRTWKAKGGEPETVADAGQLAERIKDWRNHFVELRPYGTKEHSGIIKRPEGMTDTEWEAFARGVAAGAQLMRKLTQTTSKDQDHGTTVRAHLG